MPCARCDYYPEEFVVVCRAVSVHSAVSRTVPALSGPKMSTPTSSKCPRGKSTMCCSWPWPHASLSTTVTAGLGGTPGAPSRRTNSLVSSTPVSQVRKATLRSTLPPPKTHVALVPADSVSATASPQKRFGTSPPNTAVVGASVGAAGVVEIDVAGGSESSSGSEGLVADSGVSGSLVVVDVDVVVGRLWLVAVTLPTQLSVAITIKMVTSRIPRGGRSQVTAGTMTVMGG